MSILIKGMEMPTNCFDCKMRMAIGCIGVLQYQNTRMPNCPLIELPPHGDLIDRDALKKDIINAVVFEDRQVYDCIADAPTIIEAEEK